MIDTLPISILAQSTNQYLENFPYYSTIEASIHRQKYENPHKQSHKKYSRTSRKPSTTQNSIDYWPVSCVTSNNLATRYLSFGGPLARNRLPLSALVRRPTLTSILWHRTSMSSSLATSLISSMNSSPSSSCLSCWREGVRALELGDLDLWNNVFWYIFNFDVDEFVSIVFYMRIWKVFIVL